MTGDEYQVLTIRIKKKYHENLQKEAKDKEVSIAHIVRTLIKDHLEQQSH